MSTNKQTKAVRVPEEHTHPAAEMPSQRQPEYRVHRQRETGREHMKEVLTLQERYTRTMGKIQEASELTRGLFLVETPQEFRKREGKIQKLLREADALCAGLPEEATFGGSAEGRTVVAEKIADAKKKLGSERTFFFRESGDHPRGQAA